ncbi:secretion protein E [Leuconostoc litchii]|uniref:Type II secretory pathway protein n=1 Tax=Leuconostoc litchii TaxID=1981069 RepID=A0A6P2CPY9_9LACO|nr:competence type IV pilus ATPase ComGA [Leuconostoc litchii]TYC47453.1 type II secretory pathway protein [Leuconostoc litchii]GMA69471.1 secretion protein E [Leuconostoc litchii]
MKIEQLLDQAIEEQVSDIYILPNDTYDIKFHVAGHIVPKQTLPNSKAEKMIAAIKYQAKMNISERRRPQLGRFQRGDTWIRVSTVGDFMNRETVVLRLIYSRHHTQYWLEEKQFDEINSNLPDAGLFLISGPTGSGKTTTLYRLLASIAKNKLVLTIEDPVEMCVPEFVQLQVNETAGIDYTELIKVALRHRPEILLIGEIRDTKTAKAVVQAALSGHLVFSTIHALSAKDVRLRLLELGVDKHQLEVALMKTVYQRLVPTTDGQQAAIADILTYHTLEEYTQQIDDWQQILREALEKKRITHATYQKFISL